ncbi:hypothetical protein BU16DRAFT_582231 [Lophium mytilinum]|uniref:Uncharacterized protein n=1 Tax=Lophium mytilinum TaxID=390894 RepID=A0A6A6QT56_9PEZI|nr:hypothetical protein BU16DRAFT_582231 [Lophium mytilinum]
MCIVSVTEAASCGHPVEEENQLCGKARRNYNQECVPSTRIIEGRVPGLCRGCREADMDRRDMADTARVTEASRRAAAAKEDERLRSTLEASRRQAPERWEANLQSVLERSKREAPPAGWDSDIDAVLAASRADFEAQEAAREAQEVEMLLAASMRDWSEQIARAPKEYYRFNVKFSCGHKVDMGQSKIERQPGAQGPGYFEQDDPFECPDCQGRGGSSMGPAVRWEALSRPRPEKKREESGSVTSGQAPVGKSQAPVGKSQTPITKSQTTSYMDEFEDLAPGTKGKGRRDEASVARSESPAAVTVSTSSRVGGLTKQMEKMGIEKLKPLEHILPSAEQMRQKRLAHLGTMPKTSSRTGQPTPQSTTAASTCGQNTSQAQSSSSGRKDSQSQIGLASPKPQAGAASLKTTASPGSQLNLAFKKSAETKAPEPVLPPTEKMRQQRLAHLSASQQPSTSKRGTPSRTEGASSVRGPTVPRQQDTTSVHGQPSSQVGTSGSSTVLGSPRSQLSPTTKRPADAKKAVEVKKPMEIKKEARPFLTPAEKMRQQHLANLRGLQHATSERGESASRAGGSSLMRDDSASQRSDSASLRGQPDPQVRTVGPRTVVDSQGLQSPTAKRPTEMKGPVAATRPVQDKPAVPKLGAVSQVADNRSTVGKALEPVEEAEEEKDSESEPEPEDPDYVRQQRLARFK